MERVLSWHRFAFFATSRVERLRRAQDVVRGREVLGRTGVLESDEAINRAAKIVARDVLGRARVMEAEVIDYRRARRDERGRWVVTARPPAAEEEV